MDDSNVQKTEIPPKEIFQLMKANIFDNFTHYSLISINKDYINSRKALFNLLHKITIRMGFKSQTFFLCAHFLDIIFTKKKRINLNLNILGLSCLCLAAKYCENDPIVPHLQYFIKIFNNMNGYKNAILMSELKRGEVTVLKILNYKLNYFTIYDFNSFLFGHGILKIEQLKDIENKNKKLYRSARKKFVVNSTNSLMIKNILEKIYKKSRYYLDIIIKNTKICFRYNPLFISIYIMKKSVEEVLASERKINMCEKKEKEEFYEKNNLCFRQIMCDFYKINYEENEQYKRILEDEEINQIFSDKEKDKEKNEEKDKEKIEGIEPAPSADKKENKVEEHHNYNTNKNLFSCTYSTGFYNRMKLKENINDESKKSNNININNINNNKELVINSRNDKINIEKNNSSSSGSEESKEEDNLEMNLNINAIQNERNKKNSKKNTNTYLYSTIDSNKENKGNLIQNKYMIQTNNRDNNNTINKKNIGTNYDLTYSVEPSRGNKIYINNTKEKTSPLKYGINNNNSYTGIKKYVKIKGINTALDRERTDFSYNTNNNDNLSSNNSNNNSSTNLKFNYSYNTIKKFEKQPYFKKLINNDSNINSINRNGIPYYITNTDLNKNKIDNSYRNTINSTNMNTYNRIKAKNIKNKNSENNSIINNNIEENLNINELSKNEPQMSTTSSRYRKTFYRNRREENNNLNNISTEVKNAKDFIIEDNNINNNNNELNNNNKKEIESYTQYNWNINSNNNKGSIFNKFRNNNIFMRKSRILNMEDNLNNSEDKKNLTSRNFYKNTNININNINNNNSNSNRITVNTLHNNNLSEKKIEVNTIENSGTQRVYQSIRQKYLNMRNNNKINNSANNSNNMSMEVDKNKTANYFYKKNNININNANIPNKNIREKYEPQNENKTKYKKFSDYSIFNIINKTKGFFSKSNINNNNEENKRISDKKNNQSNNNSVNYINNNDIFYKSQDNFYQPKNKGEINVGNNNNINNISRKEQEIKNNSYVSKHIINNKINNRDNPNSQNKKNSSTIVINNNININIGNKTNNINNEYTKYKNIYKKNSIQPTNLKKSNNSDNNNINMNQNNNYKNSNNKVNKGINFSNILNKFQFYRKNMNNKNNDNNNN